MSEIEEMLEMAIRAEIDSEKIYLQVSQMAKNKLLKEKLEFLAKEESKHKELLENIFHIKFQDRELEIPPSTKVPLPQIEIHKNEPLYDILTQAMDAEEKTAIFYQDLAKKLKDGEAASLMQYLSSVEKSHYYLLESEKELLMQMEKYSGNYKYYSLNP